MSALFLDSLADSDSSSPTTPGSRIGALREMVARHLQRLFGGEARIQRRKMGIYSVSVLEQKAWTNYFEKIFKAFGSLPLFHRLLSEVFKLCPKLTILYIISRIFNGLHSTLMLYTSTHLLKKIEGAIVSRRPDPKGILQGLALRLACIVIMTSFNQVCQPLGPLLQARITNHYDSLIMRAQLKARLEVIENQSDEFAVPMASGIYAWSSFASFISVFEQGTTTMSQLVLLARASRDTPIFFFMCLSRPVRWLQGSQDLWRCAYVFYTDNMAYKRKNAFWRMFSSEFRSEVVANDLGDYVVDEYEQAVAAHGTESDMDPQHQALEEYDIIANIVTTVFSDLPMVYCGIIALTDPASVSVSQIAIWQQSGNSLDFAFHAISNNISYLQSRGQALQEIYDILSEESAMPDGKLTYPPSQAEHEKNIGMSFELRGLSFSYPGSQKSTSALDNVSCSIKAGQLVVIVGSNGSGKSTLIKLMTRIHESTAPPEALIVDGHPISEYQIACLRQATAILTQDHSLFPLSLGENIGLGHVENVEDVDAIHRAAELGGAEQCLSNLTDGLETVLDPIYHPKRRGFRTTDLEHPLQAELAKLPKVIELSGGEKQRIVASRTFMRFESQKIRFVAVDEPTSALDAQGEQDLFDNLIRMREGKTLVFVTHKFGNLTKRADLILCMKDGRLAESGTHEELIEAAGEYAKLYNIQAKAFTEDVLAKKSC